MYMYSTGGGGSCYWCDYMYHVQETEEKRKGMAMCVLIDVVHEYPKEHPKSVCLLLT